MTGFVVLKLDDGWPKEVYLRREAVVMVQSTENGIGSLVSLDGGHTVVVRVMPSLAVKALSWVEATS